MSAILRHPRHCQFCGPFVLKDKTPETVNGTPEPIMETGATNAAAVTGAWANDLYYSITADTAAGIQRQIQSAINEKDLAALAKPTSEAIMHGVMLGSLDSAYEADTNNTVEAAELEAPEEESVKASSRRLAGTNSTTYRILGFSSMEYERATDLFLEKKVLTRAVYDALDAKAKLKAFTMARTAKLNMLRVVQRELARQVAKGADLREFREFMKKRLERAGWTPANKSHVEGIFRTNVQSAYNAGGAEHRMRPSVLKARPFWQVVTVNDGPPRQRKTHQAVHMYILRADNPIWATCHPPFGFNCRCRVRSIPSSYDGPVETTLPDLPDPGFSSGIANLL